MTIKVNTHTFNIIKAIMRNGIFAMHEMRNVEAICSYLNLVKEDKIAEWIKTHKIDYLVGLLEGFIIDNSQEAQLKEIHTTTAGKVFSVDNS